MPESFVATASHGMEGDAIWQEWIRHVREGGMCAASLGENVKGR